jgi:VanZ family protein
MNNIIIFYSFFLVLVLVILGCLPTKSFIRSSLDRCYIKAPLEVTKFIKKYRGNNYYLRNNDGTKKDNNKQCLLTGWGISHFFMYFTMGFLWPDKFQVALYIGMMYEILESGLECHDILDIFWNSTGFLVGSYFNRLLIK